MLRAERATAIEVRHDIRQVRVVRADRTSAELELTDRMPAYRIVDKSGATLRTVAARGDRTFRVRLVRGTSGWRIADLVELSP